jgi:hypothetical protein
MDRDSDDKGVYEHQAEDQPRQVNVHTTVRAGLGMLPT